MKKSLLDKIIREGTVDTRNYRYKQEWFADRIEIQRLPLSYLDTTMAINGWETVEVIR